MYCIGLPLKYPSGFWSGDLGVRLVDLALGIVFIFVAADCCLVTILVSVVLVVSLLPFRYDRMLSSPSKSVTRDLDFKLNIVVTCATKKQTMTTAVINSSKDDDPAFMVTISHWLLNVSNLRFEESLRKGQGEICIFFE